MIDGNTSPIDEATKRAREIRGATPTSKLRVGDAPRLVRICPAALSDL